MSSFGIYILCHQADLRLTRGCCESIRCFAGDVPICLLVDGPTKTGPLERQYGCQTIRREDVRDEALRTHSFGGWGYTKFISFWEGPFDRFLYLDSDTMMVGDMCAAYASVEADIVVGGDPAGVSDRRLIDTHWMNPEFIAARFPDYRIEGRGYFNAGVFFGRKGIFDRDRYLELVALQRAHPAQSFRSGDQGIFNFLVFSNADAGKLNVALRPIQSAPLYMNRRQIDALNANLGELDGRWPADPSILHYIDVKPSLFHEPAFRRRVADSQEAWPAPGWATAMNRMRQRSLLAAGHSAAAAVAIRAFEDLQYHGATVRKRLAARWKR
jgi:hypothetical protein